MSFLLEQAGGQAFTGKQRVIYLEKDVKLPRANSVSPFCLDSGGINIYYLSFTQTCGTGTCIFSFFFILMLDCNVH